MNLTYIDWDAVILDMREMNRKHSFLLLNLLTQFRSCVHYVLATSLPVSEARLFKLINFTNPNSLVFFNNNTLFSFFKKIYLNLIIFRLKLKKKNKYIQKMNI